MSKPKFSAEEWNQRHFKRVEAFTRRIDLIYYTAIVEATQVAKDAISDPEKPFTFDDYPRTTERVENLFKKMALEMIAVITIGQQSQWDFSNQKNDELVGYVLGKTKLSRSAVARYNPRNLEALAAFQSRKVMGLGLSDRVFRYTNQFRREIEMGLDVGLGEGRSAAQISRDLRGYLENPEVLFRRVRNKRGNLALSKAALNYHPGQGTYRSSFKNAVRLARTEINSAYREADHLRWQTLDFVVGIKVQRSNNPYPCDVCDSLKGVYPKNYVFRGNHANCRCYAVSILASREELSKLNRMILRDEDTSTFKSDNEVTAMNPSFLEWVDKNRERLLRAKSLPFFITDNLGRVPSLDFLR